DRDLGEGHAAPVGDRETRAGARLLRRRLLLVLLAARLRGLALDAVRDGRLDVERVVDVRGERDVAAGRDRGVADVRRRVPLGAREGDAEVLVARELLAGRVVRVGRVDAHRVQEDL